MEKQVTYADVLWTGGWDSTFRVIQLIDSGVDVQPHYIKDGDRPSTGRELRAMSEISRILTDMDDVQGRILPLIITEKLDIPCYEDVERAYSEIMKQKYIGVQYKWIAEYCLYKDIKGIDISVLNNSFIKENYNKNEYPYSTFFSNLNFPLISYSKKNMGIWCREKGYTSVIEKTWFCHSPTKKGYPCGVCSPCIVAMEESMGYRLPRQAKIRYYVRIIPRVKDLFKKWPKFYELAYRLRQSGKKR